MKYKIFFFSLISVFILAFDSCKPKPQSKNSVNSINVNAQIPKYKFKEPYTYQKANQKHVVKQGIEAGNKNLNIENNVFASTKEEIVIDKKSYTNELKNTAQSDKQLKYRNKKKLRRRSNDGMKAGAIALMIVGIVVGLLGMFIGLIVSIIDPASGTGIFIAALLFLVGCVAGSVAMFASAAKSDKIAPIIEMRAPETNTIPEEVETESEPQKDTMKSFEDKMRDLKKMHDEKIITDEEYKTLKMKTIEEYK